MTNPAPFATPWQIQVEPYLGEVEGERGTWSRHYGPAETVPVSAVYLASAEEPDISGRDVLVDTLTVLAPPETTVAGTDGPRPINGYDRVTWQGETYQVKGNAADWNTGPWQWRPGIELTITRVQG